LCGVGWSSDQHDDTVDHTATEDADSPVTTPPTQIGSLSSKGRQSVAKKLVT